MLCSETLSQKPEMVLQLRTFAFQTTKGKISIKRMRLTIKNYSSLSDTLKKKKDAVRGTILGVMSWLYAYLEKRLA